MARTWRSKSLGFQILLIIKFLIMYIANFWYLRECAWLWYLDAVILYIDANRKDIAIRSFSVFSWGLAFHVSITS